MPGQGCLYALGNNVQNSGIEKIHCAGANADYTMQEIIENTSAYRAEVDASANGPTVDDQEVVPVSERLMGGW